MTVAQYIARHQGKLVTFAHNTVMDMVFETGSPFASFTKPHAFATAIASAMMSDATAQQVEEMLHPTRLGDVIDRSGCLIHRLRTTV